MYVIICSIPGTLEDSELLSTRVQCTRVVMMEGCRICVVLSIHETVLQHHEAYNYYYL